MIQRITDKLVDFLVEKEIIRNDDREIYIYGLLALFSTVMNFFLVLFIGIVAGLLHETLIFLLGFALLRCYCGGYHAKTQSGCVLSFTAIYVFSMMVYHFMPIEYDRLFSLLSAGICLIFIFVFAPIEHKNRTFEGDEYKQFRLASRIIALIYCVIICSISLFFSQLIMVASVLSLVMLSVSFVLALGLFLNERSVSG
jgi:accessory gene regulator B